MAEELAGRLAKDLNRYGKKPLVLDPEEIEVENLPKITGMFIKKNLNLCFRSEKCFFITLCSYLWRRGSNR